MVNHVLKGMVRWFRQGRTGRKALLISAVFLLMLVCLYSGQSFSTIKFFSMMQKVSVERNQHDWDTYLDSMKDITRFLLELSKQERSRLIKLYSTYARYSKDCNIPGGYNLLILNRLLHDVPEHYFRDPPGFGFVWAGSTQEMMWPLAYDEEGRIVFEDTALILGGGYGLCHNGFAEYDFFDEHFALRLSTDLE